MGIFYHLNKLLLLSLPVYVKLEILHQIKVSNRANANVEPLLNAELLILHAFPVCNDSACCVVCKQ